MEGVEERKHDREGPKGSTAEALAAQGQGQGREPPTALPAKRVHVSSSSSEVQLDVREADDDDFNDGEEEEDEEAEETEVQRNKGNHTATTNADSPPPLSPQLSERTTATTLSQSSRRSFGGLPTTAPARWVRPPGRRRLSALRGGKKKSTTGPQAQHTKDADEREKTKKFRKKTTRVVVFSPRASSQHKASKGLATTTRASSSTSLPPARRQHRPLFHQGEDDHEAVPHAPCVELSSCFGKSKREGPTNEAPPRGGTGHGSSTPRTTTTGSRSAARPTETVADFSQDDHPQRTTMATSPRGSSVVAGGNDVNPGAARGKQRQALHHASGSAATESLRKIAEKAMYSRCYCEENVYLLLAQLARARAKQSDPLNALSWRAYGVFLSNARRRCPIWMQRAGPDDDAPCLWDYHVVVYAVSDVAKLAVVVDLDTTLPVVCDASEYVAKSLLPSLRLPSEYHPRVRLVASDVLLRHFASDRRHMKFKCDPDADPHAGDPSRAVAWRAPPPRYRPIRGSDAATDWNLDAFIDVEAGPEGTTCSADDDDDDDDALATGRTRGKEDDAALGGRRESGLVPKNLVHTDYDSVVFEDDDDRVARAAADSPRGVVLDVPTFYAWIDRVKRQSDEGLFHHHTGSNATAASASATTTTTLGAARAPAGDRPRQQRGKGVHAKNLSGPHAATGPDERDDDDDDDDDWEDDSDDDDDDDDHHHRRSSDAPASAPDGSQPAKRG